MYDLGLSKLKRPTRTWIKGKEDLTYKEGRQMFGINPFDDIDNDGVPNWKDCRPFDITRQHVFSKKPDVEWINEPTERTAINPRAPAGNHYIYGLYSAEESGYERDQWVNLGNYSAEEIPTKLEQFKQYPYIKDLIISDKPDYESFLNKKLFAGQVYQGAKTGAKAFIKGARQYSKEQNFKENIENELLPSEKAVSWYERARSRITGSGSDWMDPLGQKRPAVDTTMGSRSWAQTSSNIYQDPFMQSYQQTPKESMRRQKTIGSGILPPRPQVSRIQQPQRLPQQRTIQPPRTIQPTAIQRQQPQTDYQLAYDEDPILYRRSISDQAADLSTSVNHRDPNRQENYFEPKAFPPVDTPSIYNSTSPFARPDRKLPSAGIPGTTVQRYSPVTADQAILHKPLVGAPNVAQFGTPRGSRGFGLTNPREYWNYPNVPRGLGLTGGMTRLPQPGGILTRREETQQNQPYMFPVTQL